MPHPLLALLAVAAALLTGCASGPEVQPATLERAAVSPESDRGHDVELTIGGAVAELAIGMVGARYRYGGTDPIEGFDCSGLAFYAYTQAGYRIPRTSQEQFRAARKIALHEAGAGDLVFFQDQEKLSHVGIYLGGGRFIHAGSERTGVTVTSLGDPYWAPRYYGASRPW
jgi:cell wall-associated NlpC family hydrolase